MQGLLDLVVAVFMLVVLPGLAVVTFGVAVALAPDLFRLVLRRMAGRPQPGRESTAARSAEGGGGAGGDTAPPSRLDLERNADLRDDVERALAWYRSTMEERVPPTGDFVTITGALPLTSRRVFGFTLSLEVGALNAAAPEEGVRYLAIKVSSAVGGDISTDVGLAPNAELLDEIADGTTAAAVAKFLDRASRELWRSPQPSHPERLAESEAGNHAASSAPFDLGENADLWPDMERALQWYRATLRELPKRGEFEPVTREMLMIRGRISGLILLLEIGGVNEADPAEGVRYLAAKAYFSDRGGHMRAELGLGTHAELLREIDDGTTAAALARLLNQASRDETLWHKPPPPGPPGDVVAELTPDIQWALEWYRTTVEEHVPAEGDFTPVASSHRLTARRLRGLTLDLAVRPFHTQLPPLEVLCDLDGKVSGGGGSISIAQGVGTKAELIRELGNGTTARGLARLLDMASRDLWRGGDMSPEERAAQIAAGRHAALPFGPDCERFSPKILPGMLGPHEELYDQEHHSISLIRCEHCGQTFVQEYVEVWDDGWIFWARVSEEEAELIRQDLGWSAALVQSRRHITRPPQSDKPMYWSDGEEHVLRMGPRAGW
ncbi:MAG TPA: hypothetical protein VFS20_28510 [Longimicrobium sp.]|nr:hypothetical protein [Longimicrobium sp.]